MPNRVRAKKTALGALFLATAIVPLLLAAPGASAATEFGSSCVAGLLTSGSAAPLIVQTTHAGASVKTTEAGVVTGWKVVMSPELASRFERLEIVKFAGEEWEGIAESPPELVISGQVNEFATRIPVPAGVYFGAFSEAGVPFCSAGEGNLFTYFDGEIAPGGQRSASGLNPNSIVALAVTVEPDADGDGFGDETQDKCPTNPLVQGPCPTTVPGTGPPSAAPTAAALKISSAKLEGNTVAVKVGASVAAKITVTGSIRGKSAAAASTVTVQPGAIGRAYLTLSKATLQRLAKLPRKQHLTLVIEAKSAGSVTAGDELALPGRKAHRKRH